MVHPASHSSKRPSSAERTAPIVSTASKPPSLRIYAPYRRSGRSTVHGVIADIAWALALVTAAYAWRALRASHARLVYWCSGLFVITLIQTGLGHLITDDGHDWLIGIHVPLAFIIFGLTTWITARSIRLARHEPR
jgi:hypothetical protein